MPKLHILQGGIENGDRDWLLQAARRNLRTSRWVGPKSAQAGDEAVIYVGASFFATARVSTNAVPRRDWKRRYGVCLDSIRLVEPPIPIEEIRKRVPELTWANYPRSITTPPDEVAADVRRLVKRWTENKAADIESIVKDQKVRETTRVALIEARLGQGQFRAGVIERWRGSCAVTGCTLLELLRASHIKPWTD